MVNSQLNFERFAPLLRVPSVIVVQGLPKMTQISLPYAVYSAQALP